MDFFILFFSLKMIIIIKKWNENIENSIFYSTAQRIETLYLRRRERARYPIKWYNTEFIPIYANATIVVNKKNEKKTQTKTDEDEHASNAFRKFKLKRIADWKESVHYSLSFTHSYEFSHNIFHSIQMHEEIDTHFCPYAIGMSDFFLVIMRFWEPSWGGI